MKIRKIIDGDSSFFLDEEYAKYLARAIELMYVTRGNENSVEIILSCETGQSLTILRGALMTAKDVYNGKNLIFTRWTDTDPKQNYFPLV